MVCVIFYQKEIRGKVIVGVGEDTRDEVRGAGGASEI